MTGLVVALGQTTPAGTAVVGAPEPFCCPWRGCQTNTFPVAVAVRSEAKYVTKGGRNVSASSVAPGRELLPGRRSGLRQDHATPPNQHRRNAPRPVLEAEPTARISFEGQDITPTSAVDRCATLASRTCTIHLPRSVSSLKTRGTNRSSESWPSAGPSHGINPPGRGRSSYMNCLEIVRPQPRAYKPVLIRTSSPVGQERHRIGIALSLRPPHSGRNGSRGLSRVSVALLSPSRRQVPSDLPTQPCRKSSTWRVSVFIAARPPLAPVVTTTFPAAGSRHVPPARC